MYVNVIYSDYSLSHAGCTHGLTIIHTLHLTTVINRSRQLCVLWLVWLSGQKDLWP